MMAGPLSSIQPGGSCRVEHKAWAGDIKAVETADGGFEGYASLFGVIDSGGDVVERGAFADAIPAFIRDGFIGDGHNWGSVGEGALGTIRDAREDERGLFIKAEYHSTPSAQIARAIAQERMARGKSVGLSIGFAIAPGGAEDDRAGTRHLTRINPLFEVSQVNVPMLRPAGLTAVKGFGIPFEDHSDNVRVAVAEWLERARSGLDVRLKEGRPISESRRARMAAVRDSLQSGIAEIDALLKETAPPEKAEPPEVVQVVDSRLQALFAQLDQFDAIYGHLRGPATR
jgi:uncharacterized protein